MSYSSERSPIAEAVLKVTGRVTDMATLTGEVAQSIRNHVASLVLGLSPVRKLAAGIASEVSIGYSHSPLNAANHHLDPAPGHRAPIRASESPVGAGSTPRFVLFAEKNGMPPELMARHAALLDSELRQPYESGGLWLVRPDGYTALSARSGSWDKVEAYLDQIRP